MAKLAGWSVVLSDHRPLNAADYPWASRCVFGPPELCLRGPKVDARSAAVVSSHVLEWDAKALGCFLDRSFAYVGVLGHRGRLKDLIQYLQDMDLPVSLNGLESVHQPAGLDLGQEGMGAVALSILAEAQCVLSQRQPIHLRDRQGAIH